MSRILIADDHKSTREGLALALGGLGHSTHVAFDGEDAIVAIEKYSFDLAMVDIQMPKKTGIEVLEAFAEISPETSVVMMTAFGTIELAVEAMQKGAVDFITKPYTLEQIEVKIEQALAGRRLSQENAYLRREDELRYSFDEIMGESPQMQAGFSQDTNGRANPFDRAHRRGKRHGERAGCPGDPPAQSAPGKTLRQGQLRGAGRGRAGKRTLRP